MSAGVSGYVFFSEVRYFVQFQSLGHLTNKWIAHRLGAAGQIPKSDAPALAAINPKGVIFFCRIAGA